MALFPTNKNEAGRADDGRQNAPSNSFLNSGLFQGFRNIGTRIKAAHYQPVIEAFCACAGRIAAENGRLKQVEIAGFRRFILENHNHSVMKHFPPDELVEKFKMYAIKAFLEEEEAFVRILDPIEPGSDAAQMIIMGCLAVAFADGECDANEQALLEKLASWLGVNTGELTRGLGIDLLPVSCSASLSPAVPQPDPVPPSQQLSHSNRNQSQNVTNVSRQGVGQEKCTFCQGKGCVFCDNSGIKKL